LLGLNGGADRVSFLGQLSNQKALEVLREQDVLVLLSEAEGQPFVLLEAMISGVVPVVTDLPGTREVIADGKSGFLVGLGDLAGFASILANLARNRTQLAVMGEAASSTVRGKHAMRAAVGSFADLLATVSQMALPDEAGRAGFVYPGRRMQAWGVPQPLQGLKRRLLGQQVH
jgi:glycosyltransferase involved in cell wall biosynthesis